MERGGDCVERNRSERSKVASVAEWKPPASPESSLHTKFINRNKKFENSVLMRYGFLDSAQIFSSSWYDLGKSAWKRR